MPTWTRCLIGSSERYTERNLDPALLVCRYMAHLVPGECWEPKRDKFRVQKGGTGNSEDR